MAQIEQLLKYQAEDEKLLKLEQEALNSEERKNYVIAKNFLTKAPEKLEAMDAKAKEFEATLQSYNKQYSEVAETLGDFEHLDELVEDGANIAFYKKSLSQIIEKIKLIKSEIAAIQKAIREASEEYQTLKKKTIAMQKQYTEYSAKYKELKTAKDSEAQAVKGELVRLSSGIDKEVLARYQAKRSERIFPILCEVKNDRCSKCGTELSIVGKEKLSGGKLTECDYCHRILYKI